MDVEIYGDSPAAGFLASLLASAKMSVSWYTTGIHESLRAPLIRGPVLGRTRRFLLSHGVPVDFLLNAPELESWGLSGQESHPFIFAGIGGELDRWVDAGELSRAFAASALRLGVTVRQVPVLPSDGGSGSLAQIRCADIALERSTQSADQERWQVTEIYFSRGGTNRVDGSQVSLFEGCLGFLEPHPQNGHTLTLLSQNRHAIDRALEILSRPRGDGPQLWRLLLMANPGARRREFSVVSGLAPEGARDVYTFGQGIGTFSPVLNWDVSESLEQAERLFDDILDPDSSVDGWKRRERERFSSLQKRMAVWQKLLVSERFQGNFVEFAAWLPKSLRQYLRTPV